MLSNLKNQLVTEKKQFNDIFKLKQIFKTLGHYAWE